MSRFSTYRPRLFPFSSNRTFSQCSSIVPVPICRDVYSDPDSRSFYRSVEPTLFLLPNVLGAFADIVDQDEGLAGDDDKLLIVLVLNTDLDRQIISEFDGVEEDPDWNRLFVFHLSAEFKKALNCI